MSSEMQNSECRMQNYEDESQNAECRMQNYEDETQNSDENAEEVAEAALQGDEPSSTAHLASSMPKIASAPKGAMTRSQLREARELFPDLSDGEIFRLYKKVTN